MMKHKTLLPLLSFFIVAFAFVAKADDKVVMTIDGRDIGSSEFLYLYTKNAGEEMVKQSPREYAALFAVFKMKVMEAEACGIDTLPEFRSEYESYVDAIDPDDLLLRQEYREGMLLFEISNRRVWQKSVADSEGLSRHFTQHRTKYTWNEPRAKGWIIYTDNPEVATHACQYLDSVENRPTDIRPMLLSRFGHQLNAISYLVRKGTNPLVDALVFNTGDPVENDSGWAIATPYCFRIIDQPEEWRDVKGAVTTDYQEQLNKDWEKELWNTHTVLINYDIIDEMVGI